MKEGLRASFSSHRAAAGWTLTLQGRLLLIVSAVLLLSLLVSGVLASREFSERAEQRAIADLRSRLGVVTLWADASRSRDPAAWDALADALAERAKARVSFIGEDGRLLGDSALNLAELQKAESQRTRPEVHGALSGESRTSVRRDDRGELLRYVAAPLKASERVEVVARLAAPIVEADEVSVLRRTLLRAAAVAALVSLALAWLLLHAALRPARHLTEVASRMAEGDLSVRARVEGALEYEELGAALEQLGQGHSMALGALRQERDRMRGILSSMDEGVLFLDEDRRIALINPKLREMLLLQGNVVNRTVLEAIRHADLDELIDEALDDDDEGGGPVQGEIQVSGLLPRQLLVRAQRLEGPEVGLVAIFADVTETRRLENLRREFVANVSHELRTPVTSVCSAGETLATLLDPGEGPPRRFLDIILRNAGRMKALVEDLLDLSRIESRQFSLTLEVVEVDHVVEAVMRLHSEGARRRKVDLINSVSGGFPPVRIDRKALEHVLSNLLDNAVKYAGEGKQVRVAARAEAEFAFVEVSDNGPGIEARHLPRIFERFYRVDAGRSRAVGGTGLGLSIVKNLVESMAGGVSVESTVGAGTTFVVKIPLARGPASRPSEPI